MVDAFAATRDRLGPVDVAVACAGVLGAGGPVFDTTRRRLRGGDGRQCARLVPGRARGGPGRCGRARAVPSCCSSSLDGLQAEHGMFSVLRVEGCAAEPGACRSARPGAASASRVNCVCPSVTKTPLLDGRSARRCRMATKSCAPTRSATRSAVSCRPRHRRGDRLRSPRRWRPASPARRSRSTPASAPPRTTSVRRPRRVRPIAKAIVGRRGGDSARSADPAAARHVLSCLELCGGGSEWLAIACA